MIIDSLGDLTGDTTVNAAMFARGGAGHPVELNNLPSNIGKAVYGIYVLGWGNGFTVAGKALDIDMRKEANANVTIKVR
jgi:hypothetical protein